MNRPSRRWFLEVLPGLAARYPGAVREWLQPPGTVVYMPPGLWHAVWNVEDAVAVTQNFVARGTWEGLYESFLGAEQAFWEGRHAAEATAAERQEAVELGVVGRLDRFFGMDDLAATEAWAKAVKGQAAGELRAECSNPI